MSTPSPLQNIIHPLFTHHKLQVMIKRDDLIHPIISGNKWRKLKYNIDYTKTNNKTGIISFGGAYSNHIHALAFYCFQEQIPCIGVIRGEQHYENNFTLHQAKQWGMKLTFVNRSTYRRRSDTDYILELQQKYPNYLIVPEGGSNKLALMGVQDVIEELNQQCHFDSLLTPVGSGGTLAGLIAADHQQHNLIGIAVLKDDQLKNKNESYLTHQVKNLLPYSAQGYNNWNILADYHYGGYAKFSQQDCEKIFAFSTETGIDFEPVYSGKMVLALLDLIEQGYFPENHRIILLHTGGLQGLGGLLERGKISHKQWHVPRL